MLSNVHGPLIHHLSRLFISLVHLSMGIVLVFTFFLSFFFLFKDYFFCVSSCVPCVCSTRRGQKRASQAPGVGAGNQTTSSARAVTALTLWKISPVPSFRVLYIF